MDFVEIIQTIKSISEREDEHASEVAKGILDYVINYAGIMIVNNSIDVISIIRVAYASVLTEMKFPFAYDKVIDLYNWMKEARGNTYRIRLITDMVSLPEKDLTVYSDTLPYMTDFLSLQLAISQSILVYTEENPILM